MRKSKTLEAFFALLKAGLWETEVRLTSFGEIDYGYILQLSQEQSVVGLIAAGLEHVRDVKIPPDMALAFAGEVLQLEQHNEEMNKFIAELVEKLRAKGVCTLLVKGQGIAQCYERPLWRTSGDVDLLLDEDNYNKATTILSAVADRIVDNTSEIKHYAVEFGQWEVELHGTLHSQISKKIDSFIDQIQDETFSNKEVRVWRDVETDVFLPSYNNDVIFVFTHILQHFFLGGIGLRQLCDLARLLFSSRDVINTVCLKKRLLKMGILVEWKAFGCLLVEFLGMPEGIMPFYDKAYSKKSKKILSYILDVGNFGHNKDITYQFKRTVAVRKIITFCLQVKDSSRLMLIFPKNAILSLSNYWFRGTKFVANSILDES